MSIMSSTFVRVSVFRNDRQLDVSLPAHRPIQELLDDVVLFLDTDSEEMSGLGPGTTVVSTDTWVLSAPSIGILNAQGTLFDAGVVDGTRLYLTQRPDAARTPFVDDVMAEVRHTIAEDRWGWSGSVRARGMVAVAAVCLAGLLLPTLWAAVHAPTDLETWSVENWVIAAVLLVAGLMAVVVAFLRPVPEARWAGTVLPVVVAAVVWPPLLAQPAGAALSGLVAMTALAVVPGAVASGATRTPRRWAGALAAGVVAGIAGVVWLATSLGASTVAVLAWFSWVPVLALLIAPTLAVATSGLPALLRRNDAGDAISREAIHRRALHAEAATDAVVWAATILGVLVVVGLGSGAYWQHGLIAVLLSVVLLLRTTGYSDARTIAPLIAGGIIGLGVTCGSIPLWIHGAVDPADHMPWWLPAGGMDGWSGGATWSTWGPWLVCATVVIAGALLCVALRAKGSNDVSEARVAKLISTVDTFSTLAFIPVVLIAQGVFTYYWATT